MSNAQIGALRVTLGMDSAAFTEGLTQAQKKMKDAGARLQSIATRMAGVGVAVGAALTGAVVAVNQVTQGLVDMGNEARTAGLAFEEFQTLKYVADQAGVSIEALTDGIKEMQLRADEFATTGGGSAAEAFERIGLSGADLTEALKDPAAMFDDIIARIGTLDTAAQIRVADEIFGGTGGEQFVRLLDLGADGIARLREEFVANGGLIPQEQLEKAAAFQRAIGSVKSALTGIGTNALMNSGLIEFLTDAIPRVMAFGKALAETFGPKLRALGDAMLAMFEALGEVIIALFGGEAEAAAALKNWGEALKATFTAAIQIITASVSVITHVLRALAALMRGDFSAMWSALGDAAMSALRGVRDAFETLFPNVIASVSRLVRGVRDWLVTRFASMVVEPVRRKIDEVKGFFFGLYDAVVGNSYIPDMVEGIAAWMARLDAGMVVPARTATDAVRRTFETLRNDVSSIMERLLTETEAATRQLARETATINEAVNAGIMSRRDGDMAIGGLGGENLELGRNMDLQSLGREAWDIQEALVEGTRASREAFDELARDFGDTFANNMERALRGDIKGVFQDLLNDMLRNALAGLGRSLFSGGGSGGGILGSLAGLFGGRLPGFARGGSFNVGGSGTTDSKIIAFRATPGERVDISTRGQQRPGGGASVVHVMPSPYFDVRVQQVATPIAAAAGQGAFKAAQAVIPSQMAKQQNDAARRRFR